MIAYEAIGSSSRAERENSQAETIAALHKNNPTAKIAVIAGHGHIRKTGGTMADILQDRVEGHILSIDQSLTMSDCAAGEDISAEAPLAETPFILADDDGKIWSADRDNFDISIIHRANDRPRETYANWLLLGGKRQAVLLDDSGCQNRFPCLVSAYYQDEGKEAAAADRMVLWDKADRPIFYLGKGTYIHVAYSDTDNIYHSRLIVD